MYASFLRNFLDVWSSFNIPTDDVIEIKSSPLHSEEREDKVKALRNVFVVKGLVV